MPKLLAVDPGSTESAYVVVDTDGGLAPLWFDKVPNEDLLHLPHLHTADQVIIEMVRNYGTGMPAGKTVFDTCVWIGRYVQLRSWHPNKAILVPRKTIVTHLCGSSKAGDSNVIQALIDRFAPNTRNHGKGVKNEPGWFWGFHSDVWSAYSIAVYYADTHIDAARAAREEELRSRELDHHRRGICEHYVRGGPHCTLKRNDINATQPP